MLKVPMPLLPAWKLANETALFVASRLVVRQTALKQMAERLGRGARATCARDDHDCDGGRGQ